MPARLDPYRIHVKDLAPSSIKVPMLVQSCVLNHLMDLPLTRMPQSNYGSCFRVSIEFGLFFLFFFLYKPHVSAKQGHIYEFSSLE